eukprot:XP_014053913.1 PREDICTED: putative P2Y purinoceptor 10 isoform X2 [Salmo salar]
MNLNVSDLWEKLPVNSSGRCPYDVTGWEHQMEQLYFWFYLLLFIPGLCLNTTALWVLCRHISKKTKAVIFMVNLALADLLHVMSLPLRIHYYRTHTWPFGQTLCLFCFYLKYLNMYASITFLVRTHSNLFCFYLKYLNMYASITFLVRTHSNLFCFYLKYLNMYASITFLVRTHSNLFCFYRKYLNMYASITFLVRTHSNLFCFYLKYLNMYASITFLVRTHSNLFCFYLKYLNMYASITFLVRTHSNLFCFYLKYLNMYASITFLVCISVQRCVFLLQPFYARRWRRRYDLLISATVWLVVGIFCSPFIIMRISNSTVPGQYTPSPSTSFIPSSNPSYYTGSPIPYSTPSTLPYTSPSPRPGDGCFKDLPTRKLPLPLMAAMMVLAELFGFVLPLSAISYCSLRIAHSLRQRQDREHHQNHRCPSTSQAQPSAQTDREHHHNHRCPSTSQAQPSAQMHRQTDKDKRRALRMVMSCSALFLFCFAPYHVNFLLYVMVSQDIVSHCPTMLAVRHFHPISLCVASLSCCLNPLLYYFLTAEFRQHLSQRTSSLSSSIRGRLMSLESTSSFRE